MTYIPDAKQVSDAEFYLHNSSVDGWINLEQKWTPVGRISTCALATLGLAHLTVGAILMADGLSSRGEERMSCNIIKEHAEAYGIVACIIGPLISGLILYKTKQQVDVAKWMLKTRLSYFFRTDNMQTDLCDETTPLTARRTSRIRVLTPAAIFSALYILSVIGCVFSFKNCSSAATVGQLTLPIFLDAGTYVLLSTLPSQYTNIKRVCS